MNKKTLTKLEYHKIIDILIEQATSFGGKERCKRLKPMTSLPDINTAQEQTAAAFTRIIRKGRPSFGSCNPVGESLKRLEVGAALGSGELLRICKLLENAGQIKAYGRHETVDDAEDCLDIFFQQIEPLTLISTEIRRCIIDEDEISDDASSTLKQIRQSTFYLIFSGQWFTPHLSAGFDHHNARGPLLYPGQSRIPEPGIRSNPRSVCHGLYPVHRTNVCCKTE